MAQINLKLDLKTYFDKMGTSYILKAKMPRRDNDTRFRKKDI